MFERVGGRAVDLASNVPPRCAVIEGAHDYLSRRVDLATGRRPMAITSGTRRHAAARVNRDRAARDHIERLEVAQRRPIRELALDPQNATARARLLEIEVEIATLRAQLARRE